MSRRPLFAAERLSSAVARVVPNGAQRSILCLAYALLTGCGGGASAGGRAIAVVPTPTPIPTPVPTPTGPARLPTHIVVIVQENRTVDNLFNGFPGADTVRTGLNSFGKMQPLQRVPLDAVFDVDHSYKTFVEEYDDGKMDGWNKAGFVCPQGGVPCTGLTQYGYVPPEQVAPYWTLAKQFTMADHVLQTNESSSFPAHQYLIAGQSGGYDADHLAMADSPTHTTSGCPHTHLIVVPTINMTTSYPGVLDHPILPCLDYRTIFDLMDEKGLTWRYYAPSFQYTYNIWVAPFAISHIWNSNLKYNVVTPQTTILTDIQNHQLASLSYVIPEDKLSDHSGNCTLAGPDWVATVVNAIGESKYYWKNTAVFVVWDDWGGWFDHYVPTKPADSPNDPYEYGFRVPLIGISAYSRPGYVDHTPRDFSAILGFVERSFDLPSLNARDKTTDDLFSMFQFTSLHPLRYVPIDTNGYTPSYFLRHPIDTSPIDY
jgi:phospholipase C